MNPGIFPFPAGRSNFPQNTTVGGTQSVLVYRRIVRATEVLILPSGDYDIVAIGNAGSGGCAFGANARATGGGGPAWSRDWGTSEVPNTLTVTIGTRAAGVSPGSGIQDGNDGGDVSVVGTGINILLTGGKRGKQAIVIGAVDGGLGGVATGGKINVNGSRAGNITSAASSAGIKATGGGALNLFRIEEPDATRGGDVTGGTAAATGGGGLGGKGGDNSGSVPDTAGGGAGGDAVGAIAGPTITGIATAATTPDSITVLDVLATFPGLTPTGSGTAPGGSANAPGGGTASGINLAVSLGASGGVQTASVATTGAVENGGGSGGAASSGNLTNSGNGGKGLVIISVYRGVS